jgi:VanZ family protein
LVFATLYGLTDEWHQSFVPGRSAAVADALADMVGAIVGSAAWLMLWARINKTKTPRS